MEAICEKCKKEMQWMLDNDDNVLLLVCHNCRYTIRGLPNWLLLSKDEFTKQKFGFTWD